ncbi:putative ABC transporter permease [Erysipelothrix sp. HDW6B]|uniref:putative ABC transporter permease n=1 Tax=Erysipelothrix TaxID=1647 RepID=UPI00135AAE7F|nr:MULTISPECIES: putative ABC transporter permease [Erysipelothrix]QIK86256.1 putative ABC transporter permease [Erysipelothrix sp. HDW6B]
MNSQLALLFVYWIIYSFIGWILETVYCSILSGKFEERGFLNGPLVPIYGFGAMIILATLLPYAFNPVLVFILGLILTSSLEYLTSYIMEKAFKMRWWDYSEMFMNINGRVCLLNSTMFGALSLVLVEYIHPVIVDLVANISIEYLNYIAFTLFVVVIIDFIASLRATLNLQSRLFELNNIKYEIDKLKSKLEGSYEIRLKELNTSYDTLKATLKSREVRLLKAFPRLKSESLQEFIEDVQDFYRIRKNKK